jgi:hypothetical protein
LPHWVLYVALRAHFPAFHGYFGTWTACARPCCSALLAAPGICGWRVVPFDGA